MANRLYENLESDAASEYFVDAGGQPIGSDAQLFQSFFNALNGLNLIT